MTDKGQALGWDDEVEVTSSEYELLPAGTYDFEVTDFIRGRHEGSANIGPCPMAKVRVRCAGVQGTTAAGTAYVNFYLNTKTLWKITQFLKSTGILDPDAPEGQAYPMSLFSRDSAMGATGRCKVKITQSKSNGKTYDNNEFTFMKPETAPAGNGGLF